MLPVISSNWEHAGLHFIFMKIYIKIMLFLFISIFLGGFIIIATCSWRVRHVASGHIWNDIDKIPSHRVALLLGTNPKGKNGKANVYYLKRINATVDLYRKGKIKRILISGDNSSKSYSEPDQM